MSQEQRRGAAVLWFDEGDATAVVGAEAKVDGGGRARALGRRKEGDDVRGTRGKDENDPRPYL